jgi:Porin subfamily
MALAELRSFDPSYSIVGPLFYANGAPHLGAGFVPSPSQYSNARSRDATDFAALGRVELDARTQSPLGSLRSFIRVDSFYGSNGSAALGSLGSQAATFNTTAGTSASRDTTIVSRAFIQFAGLTAGRAQSMFDFYADAINYKSARVQRSRLFIGLYGDLRQRFLGNALL